MIKPRKQILNVNRLSDEDFDRSNYLRLDLNELVPHLENAVFEEIIKQLEPATFSSYPYQERVYDLLANSLNVTRDHITLTEGADGAIRRIFEVFCDPGDELLITSPTFGMYYVYPQLYGLHLKQIECKPDLSFDLISILESITSSTRLLAIANPNGATGYELSPSELTRILKHAESTNTLTIIDETFVDFCSYPSSLDVDDFENLIIVRSFSKAAGLAGLRLGYLLSNSEIQNWLKRANPFVGVNSVAIIAAEYLLQNPSIIEHTAKSIKAGRNYLHDQLIELGFACHPCQTNFVLVDFGEYRAHVISELKNQKVLVADLEHKPSLSKYTRITAGPIDVMEYLVKIIKDIII